jgi:hypothetical protein
MDYLDSLIKNHSLSDNKQYGGDISKPNGSFPPIIICIKKGRDEIDTEEDKKRRE